MNRKLLLLLTTLGLIPTLRAEPIITKQDLLAQAPPTSAEPLRSDLLDEITVTATRREVRLRDTPSTIYVIPAKEIERKGANSVGEAIRGVPGVQSNIFGAGADVHNNYFVRGLPNSGLGILVDGRLITNLNQEHFDLADLPVFNVERIEVLTGSGATLYGSNAVGGVINVITKQPTGPLEGTTKVEFGSYGYSKYLVSYRGKIERFGFNVDYQQFDASNDYYYEIKRPNGVFKGTRTNGYARSKDYDLNLSYDFDERNRLRFDSYYRNVTKGIAPFSIIDPSRPLIDPDTNETQFEVSRLTDTSYGLALTYNLEIAEGSQVQVSSALDNTRITEAAAYDPEDLGTFTDVSAFNFSIRHAWQINENNNITYGFDYIREFGKSADNNPGGTFNFDAAAGRPGLFALYTWKPVSEVTLVGGIRQTIPDPITARGLTRTIPSSLDPSLGLRWQITPTIAFRTNYQQVYRAPNFNDLFGRTTHIGNPFLEPETGTAYDIGFDWQTGNTSLLRITYFHSDINNLVDYLLVRNSCAANGLDPSSLACTSNPDFNNDPASNAERFRVDYPLVSTSGFEAAFNWQITPEWNTFATLTLTDSRVVGAPDPQLINEQLDQVGALNNSDEGLFGVDVAERNRLIQTQYPLVPYSTARIGVTYAQPSGLEVSLFGNLSGQRTVDVNHVGPFDTTNPARLAPGTLIEGYATVDLSARFPLGNSLILNTYIDNLLGTYYERSYGNAAPGINFRAGLAYTF